MSIFGAIVSFVVVWWLVLFMVLPWYVHADLDNNTKGIERGAPKDPRLKFKFIVTTILSFALWGFFVFLFQMDIVSIKNFL